ncbi:hypothetical protein [Streptomyces sp. NPDC058644]|uniref:hypothetical protein n=1 Tax=unclassified Streptomyces TaxID=2593676 RepID=UPI0036523FB3
MDSEQRFPCRLCGHARTAERCWECDFGDQADRNGLFDLVTVGLTTALLQPFVQALATKAGEDVWPKIASLVRREQAEPPEETRAHVAAAELLEVVVQDRRLVLLLPKHLPAEAVAQLRQLQETLRGADGWLRVAYDAATCTWEISPLPEGPEASPGTANS